MPMAFRKKICQVIFGVYFRNSLKILCFHSWALVLVWVRFWIIGIANVSCWFSYGSTVVRDCIFRWNDPQGRILW